MEVPVSPSDIRRLLIRRYSNIRISVNNVHDIIKLFDKQGILGLICDVTKEEDVRRSVEATIAHFGGLDILISNAGIFPAGEMIEHVQPETWNRSIDINLSSHQQLLQQCIPFLSWGIGPAIIVIASKNVSAPGPGASAYSVAKAGLTQLVRVAASACFRSLRARSNARLWRRPRLPPRS